VVMWETGLSSYSVPAMRGYLIVWAASAAKYITRAPPPGWRGYR